MALFEDRVALLAALFVLAGASAMLFLIFFNLFLIVVSGQFQPPKETVLKLLKTKQHS